MQHLRDYVNPEGIQSPVEIKSQTARRWLHKLGFGFKDVKKDVFVDGHKQPNVVEDRANFLKLMKDMEPYLVEFNADSTMKDKAYLPGCAVNNDNCRPVITITYDECTFSANDGIRKAWIQIREIFLWPKRQGQSIMSSDFLLPFGYLNLFSLSKKKKKEVMEKTRLTITKVVELFEYEKANKGY